MQTQKLAPNRQAEQSLDIQTVELPADLRLAAIQAPATLFLCRLEGGDVVAQLNDKLAAVAAACYTLGKKGEITLKLKFAPGGRNTMNIQAAITAKIPEPAGPETALFVTQDGQLLAHDPDQQRMDLRVMKVHEADIRVIDVPETPLRSNPLSAA